MRNYWLHSFHGPTRTRVWGSSVGRLDQETVRRAGMNTSVCSPVSSQASPSGLVALRFGSGPAKPSHLPYFPCLPQEMAVYPPLRDYWSLCARFIPRACLLCSKEPVVEFPSEPLTSFLAAVSPVWTSLGKWYRTCLFELLALFVSSTLPHSQLALKNFSCYPDKAWSPITMFQSLFLSCLTAWVNFTLRQFRFVLACYLSCWKWMLEATMCKFVSKAAMGVNKGGRSPLLYPRCLSPVVCLFVTVPLCTYVVDSRKSSQILMFPIINQYKSHSEIQGSEPWICSFMMSETTLPIPRDRNRHFDTPRELQIWPWPCSFIHICLFIQQNSSTL